MISAIVFDCFGVLTTDGWLPFKSKMFGHDPTLIEQATALNKRSDAGIISYDDFITAIGKLADMPVRDAQKAIEDNVSNKPLFVRIEELKKDYKIGLLSNAADNWLAEMFTPEELAVFDGIALSYETGYIKPDSRAYEAIADRLGVELQECVLIDDQERYCTGAREAGMHALWYRGDVTQTIAELNELLNP